MNLTAVTEEVNLDYHHKINIILHETYSKRAYHVCATTTPLYAIAIAKTANRLRLIVAQHLEAIKKASESARRGSAEDVDFQYHRCPTYLIARSTETG